MTRRRSVSTPDGTATRRGRRGSGTIAAASTPASGQSTSAATEHQPEETTTSTTDADTPSPPFSASKTSRGSQSRKKSGTKKAKPVEAHGISVSAAAELGAHAEEAVVAKHSKHHSSHAKPSSTPDLLPAPHSLPEPPLPVSKAVANDRPGSSGRRHAHVPSAPVQSPELACESFVATNPAVVPAEQPPTTPNKMPDQTVVQPTDAPPLEAKSGVANDHTKPAKSAPEPLLAAPVQPPEPTQPDAQKPPLTTVSSQEPPIALNKKLPEQVAPAASDRVFEARLQHFGPGTINVPVSEPQQPSS
ncbi:hypothetical protein MTO96_032967, partial [Rhipicephalus appendiculatus]